MQQTHSINYTLILKWKKRCREFYKILKHVLDLS